MLSDNCQKIKLLHLMEILRQETDAEHPMRTQEICSRLLAEGTSCNPRTVGRDVSLLNSHGYEIKWVIRNHEKYYYIENKEFNIPEVKILIDAIQAANFIPEAKTEELIDKLAELGGSHRAEILKSNLVKFNTRKHTNETVYATVENLEKAIRKKKQISFRYFDLNEKGNRIFRKEGAEYTTEPVALVYNDDNYYLISYSAKYKSQTTYRVDRMEQVRVLNAPICEEARKLKNKMSRYTKEVFRMFNGEEVKVTLRFDEKLIGVVFDKFGEDTKMTRIDEHTIEANVPICVAPTFWGWLFQFGKNMEIVRPEKLKEEYFKKIMLMME